MQFRRREWKLEPVAKHGIRPEEAEWVVDRYSARDGGDDKYKVWGQSEAGRCLQVVFVLDLDERAFIVHARELTDLEKRRFRRQRK